MAIQERSFGQIFGEHPDPTDEVSEQSIQATLYGAALILQEDPSESAIADTIGYFLKKPETYIRDAYGIACRTFFSGDNSKDFIGEIINKIYTHGEYESTDKDLDPQFEAENMVDDLWVKREDERWKETGKKLGEETDRNKRVDLALQIKQEVVDYIAQNPVIFRGANERQVIPTWENISVTSARAKIKMRHFEGPVPALDEVSRNIRQVVARTELEDVLDQLPNVDKELFDGLRNTFGAKAANLIILQDIASKVNDLLMGNGESYGKVPGMREIQVPDFVAVPVDLYKKWTSGESIDEDLQPYYEWVKDLAIKGGGYYVDEQDAYIVRSSAVNSEDGDKLTGAGIYDSVVVDYDEAGSFEAFKDAVFSVFNSTNSEKAISYRAENGVDGEEMGLIIQRLVPGKYAYTYGGQHNVTINSFTAGVKDLTEIVEGSHRYFVRKDVVDDNLSFDIPNHAVHFNPDHSDNLRALSTNELTKYAVISSILERVWGGSIQLEMVEEYLVQVRKITDRFSSKVIEFPDEQEIARGSGVGIGDKTLKILRGKSNNWEKEGLVQFPTNWEWSLRGSPDFLPRDGAVVVQTNGDGNGHLQTLCMERGLICMYPRGDREGAFIPDLKIGKEVRIVSNGMEARMYQVGDESPFAERDNEWE